MVTGHVLGRRPRRAIGGLSLLAALAIGACGSSSSTSSSSGGAGNTPPTPTALPTSTPGPSSVAATLDGSTGLSGALRVGGVHFVTCGEPSLSGPTILAFRSAPDPSVGVLLTIHQSKIEVRLASGSGTSYTERTFAGTGVTSFNADAGAQFSASLTESTAAGTNTGSIGTVSSISGSVSCGTFEPGSAAVMVAGSTAGGPVTGSLSSVRVLCGNNGQGQYATVTGLAMVGSTPAVITVGGGTQGAPLFVLVQTAATSSEYNSSAAGSATVTAAGATYNGHVTETSPIPGAHTLTVSGTAVCGNSS